MGAVLNIKGMDFALSPEQLSIYNKIISDITSHRDKIHKNQLLKLTSGAAIACTVGHFATPLYLLLSNPFTTSALFTSTVTIGGVSIPLVKVLDQKFNISVTNEEEAQYVVNLFKLDKFYRDIISEKSLQYTGNRDIFLNNGFYKMNTSDVKQLMLSAGNGVDIMSTPHSSYLTMDVDLDRYFKINNPNNTIPIIREVSNPEEVEQSNSNNQKVLVQYETQRANINKNTPINNQDSQEESTIKKSFWDSEYGKKLDKYIQNLKGLDPKTVGFTVLGTFLLGLGLYKGFKLWKKYKNNKSDINKLKE